MARKAKLPKGKRMNPTFFVFCEGKTEAAYVDLLRHSFRVPVEIIVKVSDSNISRPYIDRCMRDRFTTSEDRIFLMFDLDVPGTLAHMSKIKDATLLLSNPCIEYWFLLHFDNINREMTSAECLARLKSISDYSKGTVSSAMKKMLTENIHLAAFRAKSKTPYANPSSTVYLLADELTKGK